jgi:hypothetical protein
MDDTDGHRHGQRERHHQEDSDEIEHDGTHFSPPKRISLLLALHSALSSSQKLSSQLTYVDVANRPSFAMSLSPGDKPAGNLAGAHLVVAA